MEKENYRMHGQAPQDSFYWMNGVLADIHGPERDSRGNKRPQDPTMYGQICGSMYDASKRKATQKWAIEKPKVVNAGETCRSIAKHKTKFACIVEADESTRI